MENDLLHREIARMARELADKEREIQRLNDECTRLAARNAVLVYEIDRERELKSDLYRGQG